MSRWAGGLRDQIHQWKSWRGRVPKLPKDPWRRSTASGVWDGPERAPFRGSSGNEKMIGSESGPGVTSPCR